MAIFALLTVRKPRRQPAKLEVLGKFRESS